MTAQSIGVFTIEFPDPFTLSYYNDKIVTLNSNVSFQYPIRDNIRTLSSNGASTGNDPYGILFVPDLISDDCKNSEIDHIPANATRRRNLPDIDYSLVALAPWSPQCIEEYFTSARLAPIKAFLVYLPGNGTDTPPLVSDPLWGLGDGGSWKSANHFPVYAISGLSGSIIMNQLDLYSGNVTTVPHGHDLASMYSPTDYIRLWTTIDAGSGNQIPSLWVFLVIVLGLLIFIIGLTSLLMHLVQRRRRNALRQRVINGEVDLEVLGVKRLTIPREHLEKMPLYTYTVNPHASTHEQTNASLSKDEIPLPVPPLSALTKEIVADINPTNATLRRSSAPSAPTSMPTAFSQPTCPICLDDFVDNVTQVRELPCRHIFHPDCVDPFLLRNSSLCPMCKKSTLPPGYCPANITNAMVRRERMIRRFRQRNSDNRDGMVRTPGGFRQMMGIGLRGGHAPASPPDGSPRRAFMNGSLGRAFTGRRVFSAPVRTRPTDIEMAGATPPEQVNRSTPADEENGMAATQQSNAGQAEACPSQHPDGANRRREWARQRAMALLGTHRTAGLATVEEEEAGSLRGWRKAFRKAFPGWR